MSAGDNAHDLAALARLLDEALDQPTATRADWLTALAQEVPAQHAALLELLSSHEQAEAEDFLNRTLSVELLAQGHDAPGVQRLGPYRLLRKVGDGGMSSVFLAERADGQFEGEVAIKLLPPALASHTGFRERLQHEARVLARLSHPHIAKLLDADIGDGGTPYLVLELVQGQSIAAYCDERKLDVGARVELMRQVCDAVGYLHGNLVIHRDIKPSNILVDVGGTVKLVDFGIAKLVGDVGELTREHGGAFTPDYAAPEQIRGVTLTTAADVYSLGAVLHRLLTGVKPQGKGDSVSRPSALFGVTSTLPPNERDALARQRGQTARRLERQMRDELDLVLLKALAHEPAERYASATSLAADLAAYSNGLPVAAKRPTWRYAARKFTVRHRAGVSAGLLALVCIVGLSGFSLWQAQRATTEAARTQKVLTFVTELLGKSNPNATDGKRVTVKELLDGAVPDVQRQFADDPDVQRRVLDVIGTVMQYSGDFPAFVDLTRAQWQTTVSARGSNSLQATQDQMAYGYALYRAGKYGQAVDVLRDVIAKFDALGHAPDVAYLQAGVTLAECLKSLARYDEARRMGAKMEGAYRSAQGLREHHRGVFALMMMQVYNFDTKELARWLDFVEAEHSFDKLDGPIDQHLARMTYARELHGVGKTVQAHAVYRRYFDDAIRLVGDNSQTRLVLYERGDVEAELMLVEDARRHYQAAIEAYSRAGSTERDDAAHRLLARQGLLEWHALDEPAASRFLEAARVAPGGWPSSPLASELEAVLAIGQGRWPDAADAVQRMREAKSKRSDPVADAGVDMLAAQVKRLQGDAMSAEGELEAVVAVFAARLPFEDARSARAKGYLAQALIDLGRHEEAASLAGDAQRLASQWLAPDHPLTSQLHYIQAQALRHLGRHEQSAERMRSAQAAFQAKLGKPLDERLMRVLY